MVLMNYKNIGDSLTTEEFNAIVSLLKHNKTLSDELEIKNGAVTGEYGTYTFDLESTTIVDNGILVTDETLTSLGTVTLSNPVFSNATYKLHLTVISMEEPNILDDNKSETTTTDLTITLQKDTAVPIPFETLTNYCIILFNATIEIKQDQPTIIGKYVTGLTLTTNKTITHSYDPTTLTIKATDLDSIGVPNKTIKLYKDNTLLTTLTTDTNGEATYTYKGDPTGEHTFQAKHYEIESETVTVQYMPLWYDDAVTSPKTVNWYKSTQNYTETIDNTGTLWTNTSATQFVANSTSTANYFLPNDEEWTVEMDVISYNDVTIRIRESTSSHTLFAFSSRGVTANSHLKIVYNGDNTLTYTIDDNAPVTMDTVEFSSNIAIGIRLNSASSTLKFKNFTIYNNATPTLELTATEDTIQTGDTSTLTMTLLYGTTPLSGETVNLYQDGTLVDTLTTDENGEAEYTYTGTGAGDVSFQAEHGTLQSETYSIEDCLLYDTTGFSKTTTTSTDTSYSTGYDYGLQSISNFQLEFDYNNPSDFRLYFASVKVVNPGDNVQYGIGFTRDGQGKLTFTERTTSTSNTTCQSISSGTNHYKVVFNGNQVSVWVNDVQQVSNKTLSWWSTHFPYYFSWAIWAVGTGTVSNLKIKAL